MTFDDRRNRKGQLGESIVDQWLMSRGWVPYRPVSGVRHPFDRLVASQNKRKLCIVEVKTKPRRNAYPDTGIDLTHFNDYSHITAEYKVPLFLAFVDAEIERRVYGNWLSVLVAPRLEKLKYPSYENGIVYFPLSAMITIRKLSQNESVAITALRQSNWQHDEYSVPGGKR